MGMARAALPILLSDEVGILENLFRRLNRGRSNTRPLESVDDLFTRPLLEPGGQFEVKCIFVLAQGNVIREAGVQQKFGPIEGRQQSVARLLSSSAKNDVSVSTRVDRHGMPIASLAIAESAENMVSVCPHGHRVLVHRKEAVMMIDPDELAPPTLRWVKRSQRTDESMKGCLVA